MGGFAWVTLATNDSYSLGALVLAHSLRRVGAKHDLAVLVTPGVTDVMREKLAAVFSLVQEVNVLDSKDETNLALLARPELGITFTKLHCWRLTQYEKCVFLDADTLVIRNCDELFEREELSAAPDVGWPDCFNSGVFVFKPSQQTFASITAFAAAKGSFDGGDQGLLNSYFSDWAHKDISKHLPFIYNMCSTATYSYLPAFKQFGEDVRIIHFIGAAKPWLQYFDTVTGIVQPPPDCNHLQPLLQNWWNIFCEHVHPQLSPVMARSTLASLWHEIIPPPLHIPPQLPPSSDNDKLTADSVRKPDFSEFKDPWETYVPHRDHFPSDDKQEGDNHRYYCPVCHECQYQSPQDESRCQNSSSPTYETVQPVPRYYIAQQNHSQSVSEYYPPAPSEEVPYSDQSHPQEHHPPPRPEIHYDSSHDHCHVLHQPPPVHQARHHDNRQQRQEERPESPRAHDRDENRERHQDFHHRHHIREHQHSQTQVHEHDRSYHPRHHPPQQEQHHHPHQHRYHHQERTHDFSHDKTSHHHRQHHESRHREHAHPEEHHPRHRDHFPDEQRKEHVEHRHVENRIPEHVHNHRDSDYSNVGDRVTCPVTNWQSDHETVRDDMTDGRTDDHVQSVPPPCESCTVPAIVATQSNQKLTGRLENKDTGLAGALAKLTLGEARSPEQIAFEEHMRKQSWEQGQIDYMGRDSFENIWKKILETLSRPPQKQKSPPKEVDEATASKETTKTETSETASTEPEEQTADLLSVIATETLSEKPVSTSVAETAPKVPGPPLDPVPPAQSSTGTPKTPEVGEPSPGVEGLLEASGAPSPEEPSAPKTETVEKSSESATTDLKQPSSEVPAETRPVPVGPPLEPFTSSADKEITAEPTSPTSTAVALKQPSAVIASPHPFAGIALGQASSETPRHLTDEPARTTAETAPPKAEAIAAKVPEEARESGDSPRQRMSFDAALESTAASILEQTLPRDISAVRPSAAGAEEGPIEAATPRAPESSGTSASVVPGSSEELPSPGKIIPEAPVTKEVDTVRETARVDPPAPAVTPEVARIDAVPSATVEPAGVVESVESPVPIQVAESVLQADLKESVSEDAKPVGEEALSSVVAPVQESATAVSETLIEPLDRPTSSDGTADVPVGSINGVDGDLPAINGLASGPTSPTTAEGVEVVPPTRPVVPVGTERSEEEQETTRSVVESEEAKKSALVESAAEVAVLESKSPESRVGAADVPSTPVSSSPRSSSSSADSATVESPVRPTRTKEIKIPATPTVTEPTPPTSPPVEGDGAEAQPKTTKKTTKKVVKKSSTEQEPSDSAEADPSGKKTVKKVAKKVAKKPKEAEDGAEGSAVASKPKTVAKSAKKVSTKPSESLEVDKSVPETPPAGNAEVPVPPKRKVKNSGPAKAPSKTDSEQ
ncbi:cardiomyopathy-associated protein 5 isoform X1 [Orussus abietinus]|uniref:cardiomyopathy-associated protein 5 isoform X1 n=1 Tax=Orussus abietinus TaxID=222816 RepID=UPI000626A4A9|nr:cardiomyopathy-associated protein 5 isoform X1 [Orussus abietinus]